MERLEQLKLFLSWFWRVAKPYWVSADKWKAFGLLAIVITFIVAVNFASVTLNEVQGQFVTSLSEKKIDEFQENLLKFIGIIVALVTISLILSVVQQKLSLYWREWLTKNFLYRYFDNQAFYKVNNEKKIDNPDQRIADDVESFVRQSIEYTLDLFSNLLSGWLFIGVLWSLNHSLVWIALATASIQTLLSFLIGRILTPLNFKDLQYQADFRYGLVHVRNNSESIAFYQGEKQENGMLQERFSRLLAVLHKAIYPRSGLAAFNSGIVYIIFLLAYGILAPQYFSGQIPFGDISRSTHAFMIVLSVFGWFATSFEELTLYAAVIKRLGTFAEFLDRSNIESEADSAIHTLLEPRFALSHVTLKTPNLEKTLVENLSFEVPPSEGILVMGPSGVGKSSILRAVAGLWDSGNGYIYRPDSQEMLFIPQRPYMVLGSFRHQITYPHTDLDVSEEQLQAILEKVNLPDLAARVGGFDVELNWADVLSLGEQQRLAFARLFLQQPKYAVLDESTSALDVRNERSLYQMLRDSEITYISVGHRPTIVPYHESIIEFLGEGRWRSLKPSEYTLDGTPNKANSSTTGEEKILD